jgi:tRNA threonylcarbamoyladenosine biosynthesis protein TsaB
MVEKALTASSTDYNELTKIAVTIGPGSFTGIRIALAAARGIGLAAKKPVVGYSGLLVLAYGANQSQKKASICAVLNAGKGEIIYQNFSAELSQLSEPTLSKLSAVIPAQAGILIGYGCENNQTFPRADFLAMLASEYPEFAVSPLPFYVRPPDAKLPS